MENLTTSIKNTLLTIANSTNLDNKISLTEALITMGCALTVQVTEPFQASFKKSRGLTLIATINGESYKTPYATWLSFNKSDKTWGLTNEVGGLSLPLNVLKRAFTN